MADYPLDDVAQLEISSETQSIRQVLLNTPVFLRDFFTGCIDVVAFQNVKGLDVVHVYPLGRDAPAGCR
jgi:hypothetical protein